MLQARARKSLTCQSGALTRRVSGTAEALLPPALAGRLRRLVALHRWRSADGLALREAIGIGGVRRLGRALHIAGPLLLDLAVRLRLCTGGRDIRLITVRIAGRLDCGLVRRCFARCAAALTVPVT